MRMCAIRVFQQQQQQQTSETSGNLRADSRMSKTGKTDPGASRHGNFMNYYTFHPAEERARQLPRGVWRPSHSDRKYLGLDIGCNSGVSFGCGSIHKYILYLYNVVIVKQQQSTYNVRVIHVSQAIL